MVETKRCRVCDALLVVGENITQYRIDTHNYICRSCNREYGRLHQNEYNHRIGKCKPMNENRECSYSEEFFVPVEEYVLNHPNRIFRPGLWQIHLKFAHFQTVGLNRNLRSGHERAELLHSVVAYI